MKHNNYTSTNVGVEKNALNSDIAVIGAGIVGICTALALQKSGKQVVLVEKNTNHDGASYGNAGHIACEQVHPIASLSILKNIPSMLLDPLGPLRIDVRYLPRLTPWFIQLLAALRTRPYQHSCKALQTINQQSLTTWGQLLAEENLSDLLQVNGSYLVAEKTNSLDALLAQIPHYHNAGVAAKAIDQATLQAQLPALNNKQLGGLFFPDTAHVISPQLVCQSLLERFQQRGGRLLHDTVLDITTSETHVDIALQKSHESLRTSQLLISSGIFSASLVKRLSGITPPLQAERGYHLMTGLPHVGLHAPVTSIDRRFIMTPMQHGLRLAGTVEYASPTAQPNYQRAKNLLPLANGMLKHPLQRTADAPWMGLRPTLPDSLPVIDRIGRIGYAFGHQHLGLTQAAVTAQWMTALMNDRVPDTDVSAYRLKRFA